MHIDDIDWRRWRPSEEATLLFVIRAEEVLLIRKKRGLGAGKINGPGGRVEPGETVLQAAVREVEEELGITPVAPEKIGEVLFQVVDGLAMRIHVFRAGDLRGIPVETPEAEPLWVSLDALPFERMWASDRFWYPWMLAGRAFEIRTLFDGDRLLGHSLVAPGAA